MADEKHELWKARRRGDEHTQRVILGVDPGASGWGKREIRPRPELEFPYHKEALLNLLRTTSGGLPRQSLEAWAARVEALDIEQAGTGLGALREIAGEYAAATQAGDASRPRPLALLTQRVGPDWAVERIGDEINKLISLFSEAPRGR